MRVPGKPEAVCWMPHGVVTQTDTMPAQRDLAPRDLPQARHDPMYRALANRRE
jgi:hypothetical protein